MMTFFLRCLLAQTLEGSGYHRDDHVIPLSEGGTTCRDNLWRLRPWHHDRKTYDHWQVTGSVHRWNLEPPDPPDPPELPGHDPP